MKINLGCTKIWIASVKDNPKQYLPIFACTKKELLYRVAELYNTSIESIRDEYNPHKASLCWDEIKKW